MRKTSLYLIASLFLGLFACEQNLIDANRQWEFTSAANANLKVVNAYTSNVPAGAPGVGVTRFYIYQDRDKLNGNALASPGSWPGPTTYSTLRTGSSAVNLILDRRVGTDYGTIQRGDTAFKGSVAMEAGKFYTLFMTGVSPTQSLWLVEDKIQDPKENFYAARFSNLVVSTTAKPVDVFSRREKRKVATNVAYRTMTDFVELPIPSTPDTLDVMDAGTTRILYSLNTFAPTSRRIYTFYTYGRTGFAAERLTNYINR
jgi:hypothetical protein